MTPFRDRVQAGEQLAIKLMDLRPERPIVFGLVRGGVEVALPVARTLEAPLAPLIVRKVGCPGQPELALGAIAPDQVVELDSDMVDRTRVDDRSLQAVIEAAFEELERRREEFEPQGGPDIWGRVCIAVDDGLATGSTAAVAGEYLKRKGAKTTVLAIPVAPPEACARMALIYDRVEFLRCIPNFRSVGQWYIDFRQLTDEDVKGMLGLDEGRNRE